MPTEGDIVIEGQEQNGGGEVQKTEPLFIKTPEPVVGETTPELPNKSIKEKMSLGERKDRKGSAKKKPDEQPIELTLKIDINIDETESGGDAAAATEETRRMASRETWLAARSILDVAFSAWKTTRRGTMREMRRLVAVLEGHVDRLRFVDGEKKHINAVVPFRDPQSSMKMTENEQIQNAVASIAVDDSTTIVVEITVLPRNTPTWDAPKDRAEDRFDERAIEETKCLLERDREATKRICRAIDNLRRCKEELTQAFHTKTKTRGRSREDVDESLKFDDGVRRRFTSDVGAKSVFVESLTKEVNAASRRWFALVADPATSCKTSTRTLKALIRTMNAQRRAITQVIDETK